MKISIIRSISKIIHPLSPRKHIKNYILLTTLDNEILLLSLAIELRVEAHPLKVKTSIKIKNKTIKFLTFLELLIA